MKTRSPFRHLLRIPALNVCFLLLASAVASFAHEDQHTHPALSEGAALFLDMAHPEDGALVPQSARNSIRQGSINEDACPNYLNHFYNPKTGANNQGRVSPLCPDFLPYNTAPGRAAAFWVDAVHAYRQGSRDLAFTHLGHVFHLLQDMTSPAHVHLDTHAQVGAGGEGCYDGDDFENWGWSPACTDFGPFDNISLYVRRFNNGSTRLETQMLIGLQTIFQNRPQLVSKRNSDINIAYSFVHVLADQVYDFTSFDVYLADSTSYPDNGAGELETMFPGLIEYSSYGWWIPNLGWSQGECGSNQDQDWWLEDYGCYTDTCGFFCTVDGGLAYIENTGGGDGDDYAIPNTLRPAEYNHTWFRQRYGSIRNDSGTPCCRSTVIFCTPLRSPTARGSSKPSWMKPSCQNRSLNQPLCLTGSTRLNGRANPGGVSATAWFEWGTSTAFGNLTLPQVISSDGNPSIGHSISGLLPETTYHYRVVSSNQYGIRYGTNRTFRAIQVLWLVGLDDDDWNFHANNPGNGGGRNATFVVEANVNPLPGNPASPEVDQQADDDYYFAGLYTNVINSVVARYGPYTPVGLVSANEEAVERAFGRDDNELRYHFNLPNTVRPSDLVWVSFDALNLDDSVGNPRYGVEVYFNGVLVQTQIVIRAAQLGQTFSTRPFTLGSVNAAVGLGPDNIVTLKGVNHSAEGGGNWMGIDYVQLNGSTNAEPLQVMAPVVSGGRITLNWTGAGGLESAPSITGPWTPFTPSPTPPYSEAVAPGQMRFYRLRE